MLLILVSSYSYSILHPIKAGAGHLSAVLITHLSARLMSLPVMCIAHLSAGFFSLPVFYITHFSNALPVKR